MPWLVPEVSLASLLYGMAYAAGIGAFYAMARARSLATDGIRLVAVWGLIGGLVGASASQWIVTGGAPGKSVLGGVAGGYLSVVAVKAWLGLRRPTGDLFAVALTAGEAVGRWGCFVGGCCYGRACELPWAVWQHGAWRHPSQLYLAGACTLLLGALIAVERWVRLPENGLFYLQGLLYCPIRFGVEFFRDGPAGIGGLSGAQWACGAGAVFFAVALARRLRRGERR